MATKALRRIVAALQPGAQGERLAAEHLTDKGFEILERNFRCRSGEIDIVARDGDVTVFVEVKQRAGATHGSGFDAVTFGKRRRIVHAARLYAMLRGLGEAALRFDVVVIEGGRSDRPVVRHWRGAFDAAGR